jgi:uncharacterized membrane protein
MRHAGVLALAVLCSAAFSLPASASYIVCNKTSYVLYAAVGVQAEKNITTRGWTRVIPGVCEAALKGKLSAGPYYIYARSANAHKGPARAWGGQSELCASAGNFTLKRARGAAACTGEDSFTLPFALADTDAQETWTSIFTESDKLPTMEDASTAGLQRLLADNGYKIAVEARQSPALQAALADFRKQNKLSPRASQAQLFAALEREAEKSASHDGYTVCNESAAPLWAAIAYQSGGTWVSRGWWKVAPAACARAIEKPLPVTDIFLLIENKKGKRVVTGADTFCISDASFDVTDRRRCELRGLKEAGFAATSATSRQGFTARIGEGGLIAFKPSIKD